MKGLISKAKTKLLCVLPVSVARRRITCVADCAHVPGNASGERDLLVDVSTIIRNDDRTGIQRVIRALLQQLLNRPPAGFQVRPVFATRKQGYHYVPRNKNLAHLQGSDLTNASPVNVQRGDIFLGLDLAAHILPRHNAELAQWKRLGVEINVVVYDLLPVRHPSWFNPRNTRNIRRWLRMIAIFADRLICISNTVSADLEDWLYRKYSLHPSAIPVSVIPLGADIESSMPSRGLPQNIDQMMYHLSGKPIILMVGTLEPRKGHGEMLAAFNDLWKRGRDVNLVIIGKSGWKTESLQRSIRFHPHHQTNLHWLENASDELLMLLYAKCTGVIVASHAEGFGLSLIEALYYGKHVLARDIPISREIGGDFVKYFSGGASLAQELEIWLNEIKSKQLPSGMPRYTWQDSACKLCNCLGLKQPIATQHHEASINAQNMQEVIA